MGSGELIESLHKECEEKIEQLTKDTETLSQEIREEAARRIKKFREDCRSRQALKIREETVCILSEAEKRVRAVRLKSNRTVSDRLYRLALDLLGNLRDEKYNNVFLALVREFPDRVWQGVTVNPEDEDLARRYFPDAEIVTDGSISGGLEAMSENGNIRVINTFEKRLEKTWDDILPLLIRDVYEELQDDRIASGP